jgi:hypothetical protein
MNVRVHIDRVVLDGIDLPHRERVAFRAAFERELAQRIAEGGLSPELTGGVAWPSLNVPPMTTTTAASLAESVHAGLRRGGTP